MHRSSTHPSSAGQTGASASVTSDWTCPFCPLLCDDITAGVNSDGSLSAPATHCPRLAGALTLYGAADASCKASIDGQETDLDTALARAVDILSGARRPLFGGMATDIAGARALYALAAGCGAIVDHLHGDALVASTLALQDRGAFFTTLSEVRARADLVVVFACQPSARYPRFYERAFGATDSDVPARTLKFVACEIDPAVNTGDHVSASVLGNADLFDLLALWSALLEGRSVEALHDGSGTARELATLNEAIHAARYTVFVYEPGALPGPHAALLIEALNRIIKAVNRTSRAGGLPLGGDDGALSVNQTITWLSGFPLRIRVGMPGRLAEQPSLEYDPTRFRTGSLLADREIDALLWISSFSPQPLPDTLDPDVPAIVLGHPATAATVGSARRGPTVFVPVATPGIDSGGHLFRTDSTVVVPLFAARDAGLPTVATIAARLAEGLNDVKRSAP
ncbi:formylmethanofuran dehydrogenase [Paraburkholderia sp. GAS42]|uniref:formylmethanofuran dehydrogenase n=1 Tax=Paraburkholderia sp. GAS42 TaxID=3035135 RepID=UPI003D1C5BF4